MNRKIFFLLLLHSSLNAQTALPGLPLYDEIDLTQSSLAVIDTILPDYLTDSCNSSPTYYTFNGQIISGAARLGNTDGISRVAQRLNAGSDTVSIGSILAQLVYLNDATGAGMFTASIYDTHDLETPLASSLPLGSYQMSDTAGATTINEFFFADPVIISGAFWIGLNLENAGDSLFLASTNDDCGNRSAIYYAGGSWYYYADEFNVASGDPLDIALNLWAIADRPVGKSEFAKDEFAQVYPNPASDKLHILMPHSNHSVELRICDMAGNEIFLRKLSDQLQRNLHELDISGLPAGLYLISLKSPGGFQRELLQVR